MCYTSDAPSESEMPGVKIIRVPVPFVAHVKNGRVPALLRPFNATELAARHAGPRAYQLMKKARIEAVLSDPKGSAGSLDRMAYLNLKLAMKLRHDVFRARRKAHVLWDSLAARWYRWRKRTSLRIFRRFRNGVPNIADYEVTLTPVVEGLQPDLIHAHDYHMIGVAVTAARNLRSKGLHTKVVYDAHELIEGLSYPPATLRGWLDLEGRFIHEVDAVTGVSDEQVDAIQRRYKLEVPPTVVMNAPVIDGTRQQKPANTVRDEVGADTRILAYHGNVTPERGVETLVRALADMDENVHVAVIAPTGNQEVERVRVIAEKIDVEHRFHTLNYVPNEELVGFISTADIAVVPYEATGNNDIALPNKLFEALAAGLPVLVSDMRSLSRYVSERGVGAIFQAGSASDLAAQATMMLADLERFEIPVKQAAAEAHWTSQASKLIDVYANLLEADGPTELEITPELVTETAKAIPSSRLTKLAIGPRNMAGQAYALAAAVQAHLGVPAISFAVDPGSFGFPVHNEISSELWRDPGWQRWQLEHLRNNFTHLIAESGTGMLGSMNGGFIDDQIELLREAGIKVGVLLHGSEIRDPRRHRELPHSPYADPDEATKAIEAANARLKRHLNRIDVPFFVTTPDLLVDIDSSWLPVALSTETWRSLDEPFRGKPSVLHMPTNSRLKGTEFVDPLLTDLEARGVIQYLRPDGPMPASSVASWIEQADIVVDQLVIGAYGLMSCQAMAAGRIAVANVMDIGFLAEECPVIHATPDTIGAVLESLLSERNTWKTISEAGRSFTDRFHDGRYSASVLENFLDGTRTDDS